MYNYEKFVDFVSGLLRMSPPDTVFISSEMMIERFGSDELSAYDNNENILYLCQKDDYEMMDYYNLAYSLRMIWQDIVGFEYASDEYLSGSSVPIEEIDARAFSFVAIAIRFSKAARQTYSTDPIAQIMLDKRIEELCEEFDVEVTD